MKMSSRAHKFVNRIRYRLERAHEKLWTGERRPRVIFIHTPKTGGSSISTYFKEYVGSKQSGRVVRYDDFRKLDTTLFASQAKKARFVMGHMPWSAFDLCRDENTFAFTILRDPYERLRSLYQFIINLPDDYEREPEVEEMRAMSLEDFLSSTDPRVLQYTDNYVARQFAGSLDTLPETENDRKLLAKRAIENLRSLDLVGFNDDLDSTFMRVAEVAGLPKPPAGRRVNVTSSLAASAEGKDRASRDFSEKMRKLARPLVEADLIVYRYFRQQ